MTYETYSIRIPVEGSLKVYEKFMLQYSLVEANRILLGMVEENLTNCDINVFFEKLHGSFFNEYEELKVHHHEMGFQANFPQASESRGLCLDRIFSDLANPDSGVTQSNILESFINIYEFVQIYAVFEDAVKQAYLLCKLDSSCPNNIKEKSIIKDLKSFLDNKNCKDKFLEQIQKRSLLKTMDDIQNIWMYYTNIRHLYVHSAGIVTDKWKSNYKKLYGNLTSFIKNCNFLDIEGAFKEPDQIKTSKMLYLENKAVNFFRNYIVAIMESLYLSLMVKN